MNTQKPLTPQMNTEHEAAVTREHAMFGCTAASIDKILASMSARDVVLYAMGMLSDAQEYIRKCYDGGWHVWDENADTLRQLINIAKYAMDKAVPR